MNSLEEILFSSTQILPEWILFIGILAVSLTISFSKVKIRFAYYIFSLTVVLYIFSILLAYKQVPPEGIDLYSGTIHLDKLALFIKQLSAIAAVLFMVHARLFSYKYDGEIYIFVLFILLGISILSMTTHFMTMFVSLEIISLTSYVLVTSGKTARNFEAGIKYLIFGATATAIMLFGVSLLYGMGHNLNFASLQFAEGVAKNPAGIVQIISFMVLAGLFFKVAAAPFHNWVPEVYETTSTPVISFLSFAPKAAAFTVIARMVAADFADLHTVLIVISLLSLFVGNFAALWQNNFKRLLGYSGIAQSGFILIGLIKVQDSDFYGTFFYLVTYLPMTMGSFFLADLLFRKAKTFDIPSMAGLAKKYPILSINTVIILVSLIGLPPTIGFVSKLVIFSSLAESAALSDNNLLYLLMIVGLLNAAVAIYYYLRPAYFILIKDPVKMKSDFSFDFLLTIILSYYGFSLIYLFLSPDFISEWVRGVLF